MLDLEELRRRCAQESERYFRGQSNDPSYCFELFRRAFVDQEQDAWECIYTIYKPLVARWVVSNQWFVKSGEEVQYFVNCAFEKMWSTIKPDKFTRFSEVRALLRYLKMCVGSVIIDHVRTKERLNLAELGEDEELKLLAIDALPGEVMTDQACMPVEELTLDRFDVKTLWEVIREALSSPGEYEVVYASFVLGLKPREILDLYPESFSDIHQIYQMKENLLTKLSKDTALSKFFREFSGKTR